MSEQRVQLLIAYLQALCEASKAGVKVYGEMKRTITQIEQIMREGEIE